MVANLLKGMCYPDQDQSMAVLIEVIQTGLDTQELLRIVYKHMVSMGQTLRDQLIAVDNFTSMVENAMLQATIVRLETQLASAHNALNELYGGDNDIGTDNNT